MNIIKYYQKIICSSEVYLETLPYCYIPKACKIKISLWPYCDIV